MISKKTSGLKDLRHVFRREKEQKLQDHADASLLAERESTNNEGVHEYENTRQVPKTVVQKRLTVLIATMEYDIEDWAIKVKIGGLGVMSSLMGKNLKHQDLIWVIPW